MKKISAAALICILCTVFTGCSSAANNSNAPAPETSAVTTEAAAAVTTVQPATDENGRKFDYDLTKMSSTMIYSTVSNMMLYPDQYLGKHIKLSGKFSVYHDKAADKYFFSAIVPDATACCSQGIEFVLDDSYKYPDDYPEEGADITITGDFNVYDEYGFKYCQLLNAEMKID